MKFKRNARDKYIREFMCCDPEQRVQSTRTLTMPIYIYIYEYIYN